MSAELLVPHKPKLVVNNDLQFGGKEPPEGSGNWLSRLNPGDIFLAKHIQKHEQNFELNTFHVILKTEKSVKLLVHMGEKERMIRWVDPKTFSNQMIFQEVIGNEEFAYVED